MRYVWTILLVAALGACSLAPGQLDAIKATNSCVMVSTQGSPAGGTATTTTMLPKPPIGGLGAVADLGASTPTATQTCTVTVTTTDSHAAVPK